MGQLSERNRIVAIYSYQCTKCSKCTQKLQKAPDKEISCPECASVAKFNIPSTANSVTFETKDPYKGKKLKKNHQAQLKERMSNHHDSGAEIIEKIDKYGIDEADRLGWTKKIKKKLD